MRETTKAYCNKCGSSTNHDLVATEKQEDVSEENDRYEGHYWLDLYEMLKCRGCDTATMRHTRQWGSKDDPPTTTSYPPVISRRAPLWVDHDLFSLLYAVVVPVHICSIMREVYTAVQNSSRRLAAMGIRAALESVMIDRVGDRRNFKANMDAFQEAGYLSVRQAMSLDSILDAGHAAIHRGWEPSNEEIGTLLDITESLIEIIYLHEHFVRDLDKNIPRRPPRV